jgi:hypothetical protein
VIEAVAGLLQALDELGIRYYAGGSVASSIHGIARYTQDVDLVADLQPEQTHGLAARLSSAFYADEGQMRDALRSLIQRDSLRQRIQDRYFSYAKGRVPRR